jgi:hypothetical protein
VANERRFHYPLVRKCATQTGKESPISLEAFGNIFPDLGPTETKGLCVEFDSVYHRKGIPPGMYVLIDYYCTDPKCDCRRVSLAVTDLSDEGSPNSLVTISYGFDRDMELAGPFIDPMNPCCDFGDEIFQEVKRGPLQDPEYLAVLEQHYYMVKDAIGSDSGLTYRRADPAVTQQVIANKTALKKARAKLLRAKLVRGKQQQPRRPR